MNTSTNAVIQNAVSPLKTENFSSSIEGAGGGGRGAGLQNMADLFNQLEQRPKAAGLKSAIADGGAVARRPWAGLFVTDLTDASMAEELASRAIPKGELLREAQGQLDLKLARACARRLKAKIESNGGKVNEQTERDAVGSGVLAVALWRTGAGDEPRAARVCWRAVERDISGDIYGGSVEVSSVSESWLAENAEPSAVLCVAGIETRGDKATRFLAERGRARRAREVFPRLADLTPNASARRMELVERIGRACLLILGGDSLDAAALAAGFKGDTKHPAGTRLARAVRAVVPGVQFDLRAPVKSARAVIRQNVETEFDADGNALVVEFDNGRRFVPTYGAGYVAPRADFSPLTPSVNVAALDAERARERDSWQTMVRVQRRLARREN